MKTTLFTAFSLLFSFLLVAQTPQKSFTEKLDGIKTSSKELTKSASTDNSSIGQAGEMNTSIPLVTVTSRTMSFPLQLQYSSGITVDQQSGEVGLGWALPIGSIVRDFGAFEPDYTALTNESQMKNTNSAVPNGWIKAETGSSVNPYNNGQVLGYNGIDADAMTTPMSDLYHVSVPGFISNTFWNNASQTATDQQWTLTEYERWKIIDAPKTFTIAQEFSRINELNLEPCANCTDHNYFGTGGSYAAAIGLLPYVKNGQLFLPSSSSSSGWMPTENESIVKYEDFGQFTITDEDGTVFVFGRALRGQKFMFSDDPYWSTRANVNASSNEGNFWKIDYIAEWLLTEIRSVDYVDLNNNNIADDADGGDWIRFEYTEATKVEEAHLEGGIADKVDRTVPKYREWSNFSQTDQASSLMRELAYLQKIVTPTQTIDFTISQRFDVDHDYYSKPANKVGNDHYYVDRNYSSSGTQGTEKDFDVVFPVETMKYDAITVNSKLINKHIYPNENTVTGKVVLNYAEKGSAQELAVSSYLIRDNNNNEKLINGEEIGKPSGGLIIGNYYSSAVKRGKTTLLSVDFYGSDLNEYDKSSYTFEYGFNPSYDEIHKRAIVNKYFFPSVRQGYPDNATSPEIISDYPISYSEKVQSCSGLTIQDVNHSAISPYEFLIDFPYHERYYRFTGLVADAEIESWNTIHSYDFVEVNHPLKPIKDQFGYYYVANCNQSAEAWSLTKITYPTGGIVNFEYERGVYDKSFDGGKWKFGENGVPMIKEYNSLAKQRSAVQDDYNKIATDAGFYSGWTKQKTLTATFEVDLPEYMGIRLKSKTTDDRLNPVVVTNYGYGTGHVTSLPPAYVSSCIGGFNSFIMRERRRHDWEKNYYPTAITNETGIISDYDAKMKDVAISNIVLDGYSSTHFYEYTEESAIDGSKKRITYNSFNGQIEEVYPVFSVYCSRLGASSLWDGRYIIGGNANSVSPVFVKKEELFANGQTIPYSTTTYTHVRAPLQNKSVKFVYDPDAVEPLNVVTVFGNSFEVYLPIYCPDLFSGSCVKPYRLINDLDGDSEFFMTGPLDCSSTGMPTWSTNLSNDNPRAFVYLSEKYIMANFQLPNAFYTTMQYEKWGSYVTRTTKVETSYKGMVSTVLYTYDENSHQLKSETTESTFSSEQYTTTYEYAHETYNGITTKFIDLNLFRIPTKTTTYLGDQAINTNALSANVITFDYSYPVPKPSNSYQYETTLIDHLTGVFTLPVFDATSPNWRATEASLYTYNKQGNPISSRINQVYNKTVVGNGLNTSKATIIGTERPFDATYTGFEDFSKRVLNTSWNATSYLDEDWFTNETSTATLAAKVSNSGIDLLCPNSSSYLADNSNITLYHVVSVNSVSDLTVGDQVTLSFDYSGSTTQFTTEITAILPKSLLPDIVENQALNYLVCFSATPPIPAVNPILGTTLVSNATISKVSPSYRISSSYARTGKYSYKLPTIRTQGETAKTTPVRPVKIEQQLIATECMVGQNPDEIVAKSTGNAPASCYWDYQASVWLKYDKDLVMSTPTSEPVVEQSDDASADAIYRRGTVNTTTNQGIKIICKVWNSTRTQVIEEFVFYPQAMNTAWQQFTVDIPIFKGPKQWVDVYVENNLTQSNPTFQTAKSVYVDDIVVYPKEAKYSYAVYNKFGNTTYEVNNDDVYTESTYDAKGRNTASKNAYGRTVAEMEYFDHPNWLTNHNYLTQRQWIANGLYNDTRYYLDGFGKTKQAMVSNNVRNSRMVSETNIFNSKGQVYRAYKPYALNGLALSPKYDGGFVEQTQSLYGSNYAYTEVTFEATPDAKISSVSQPRSNSESAIISSQSDYVNTLAVTHPYLATNPTFATGTLIVYELINELGSKTRTYIDNLGRVILEEHEIGNTHQQNTDGSITILGTNLGYAQTWFVYDGAGRVTATYDPDGKKTEYFYNSLGLVVKSISPDNGTSEMRYDKYGQVRFVKNTRDYEAIQTNNYGCDQFKFMKYDKWGRVSESGVLTVAPNSLGGSSSNPPFPTAEFFDDYSKVNDQAFPATTQPFVQVHAKSVYDGSRMLYASSSPITQTVYSEHGLDNSTYLYSPVKIDKITYTYMADGQSAKTTYIYDGLAGVHTITMVYNELRQPIGKDYTNSVNNNHNFKWRETLDNLGRVATTSTIHNSITTQTGKNYFDPIGNLVMMGVGSTGVSTDPHIDYQVIKKDIRDQLTSQMSKFFRVGLTYNAAGNITNQYWSNEHFDNATASSSNINQYAYAYDKMNRLIGADYKQSTLTSNPFAYFNTVSGTLPSDFSCYVNEGDVINFLHPFYAEWEENISHGENAEQSTKCLEVINQLQANYISNNVPYAVMNQTEKGTFLTAFFNTCTEMKYDILSFEVYQATKVDDQAHIDSLVKDGVTERTMKYVDLLLIDMPFVTNQDCFPNPNATAYGYLPDFVTPTATTNSTKYDAAYWYTENGNMTQLNRNDGGINPVKTIQAYSYSNALNNRLTNVVWTVAGTVIDQCNYSYDVTGNLLNDSRNGVSSIKYSTYDDMPKTIVDTNGSHEYRYFGGQRSVKEISDIDREYYIDDIVLNQTGLVKSYQTANGYVTPNPTTNGVDHFYNVKDWLGTNRAVLSSTGTVINASDTYPYGKKLPERNEFSSSYEGYRYQFTGHELDGETGYQYHGARYYNEELGRYMSVDPLAQEYMGWSPYVYVLGDPVSLTDPTGMGAEDWVRKPGSNISYDSDVTTNEEAVAKYGAGAEVVATGFSFDNRSNGDHIELLERGYFMRNGVMGRAHDYADVIPVLPARMVSLHIDEGYASNHGQGRSIMEMFTDNGGGEVTDYLNNKGMFHYDRRSAHFADWEKARANVKAIDDFAEGIMYEAVWILSGEEIIGGAIKGVKYGYDAWKIGRNGAKGGKHVIEGIYEFTSASGRKYVGQSSNIAKRLEQHIASGKLLPGSAVKTTKVLGGKTAREVAEQLRINSLGGIYQNGIKVLENMRNPIGPARQFLLP